EQGTDQRKGKKFRKLPTVNGAPAENGQSAQEKVEKNNPNAFSDQNTGKPKKLRRKELSAGQSVVEPNEQGTPSGNEKGRKFRKLPTVNGAPAENRPSVQERLRKNNPNELSDQNIGKPRKLLRRDLSGGESFVEPDQGSANRVDRGRKLRRLPNSEEGTAGPEVNVQRNFKVNRPNENAQRQFRQERPSEQVLRPQRSEPKPEFRAQPRPQMQERRVPQEQPRPQIQERRVPQEQPPQQLKKKQACGQPGEPACQQ
ncbi:peptidase C14 caspase catalytic subunit p20, partial [Mesorhizobium sp. VK24D]|nr:peptidase C14 caspase catalytic subunit p20 [Mesorhizobium sp. VK24D]